MPPPTAEEAAQFALTVEEASGPPVDVWPDNWLAVCVFDAMTTQWRTSMVGCTGLDYTPLRSVMRMIGVPPAEHGDVFDSIRILEGAALETMRAQK